MARCKQCEYPYATVTKCTNCGSKKSNWKKWKFYWWYNCDFCTAFNFKMCLSIVISKITFLI